MKELAGNLAVAEPVIHVLLWVGVVSLAIIAVMRVSDWWDSRKAHFKAYLKAKRDIISQREMLK